MQNTLPSPSVVIEWENAKISELGRARRMLHELARQIDELRPVMSEAPELIVLHNAGAIDPGVIRSCVAEAFGAHPEISFQLLPTENSSYYRQKNRGAEAASRDIVLFLDSDVVPEQKWLGELLGVMRDLSVGVVCGNTYIDPENLYAKAFAMFRFFPMRSESEGLAETKHFFANNVAFRRSLFLAHRFSEMPLLRGQCLALAEALSSEGHRLVINRSARVSHPAPNGLSHYVRRALCDGHDTIQRQRIDAADLRGGVPLGTLRRFGHHCRRSSWRIREHRRALAMGRPAAAAALAIACGYYALFAAGELLGHMSPGLVQRRLAV